ncbi:HNH endonuclease [Priestia flexa]|uniref:HNH endonuclease n=1 Tax=Priestia flexa TaxID=86664 RepID=UPI000473583C|nr:HNH endonuclease [Priestia flexa]
MIETTETTTRWNAKTKKYYVELGYTFTKMGDEFLVKVKDLPKRSSAKIIVKCDYCGEKYETTVNKRYKVFEQSSVTLKDVCKKKEYINEKTKESNLKKYRNEYAIASSVVREKINKTFKEKYNVENPFQIQEVKEAIKETCLDKYGVTSFTQTLEYKTKAEETSMKKYGTKHPTKSQIVRDKLKGRTKGEKHYNWKGGISKKNTVLRQSSEYKNWRLGVYQRDNYTCKCCNVNSNKLQAHHIENFSSNEGKRFDLENGITLCEDCHKKFHNVYGRQNNNKEQIIEFIINNG